MCYKLVISFLCALISVLYAISHATEIIFRVKLNGNHDVICNVSSARVNVKDGSELYVNVIGDFDHIHYASCSLENSNKIFLTTNSFKERPGRVAIVDNDHGSKESKQMTVTELITPDSKAYVRIKNVTQEHNGKWNCTFLCSRHQTLEKHFMFNGINYTKIDCRVYVNVEPPPFVLDKLLLCYIILGIVGIVAISVISGQSIVINRLRRKVAISKDVSLPHLERRPARNNDRARYSAMPGQKRSSKKNREESGIYQSLENLRMARNSGASPPHHGQRPPMPLPSNDNDDEHIYDVSVQNGDNRGGQTLQNMFQPPTPPSVHTLPKYSSMMNLNTPVQMEEYDYPDRAELLTQNKSNQLFKSRSGNKAPLPPPPRPLKPKPQKQSKPPAPKPSGGGARTDPVSSAGTGGASIMAELGNRLKSKKNSQKTPESAPSVTHPTPKHHPRPLPDARRPDIQAELTQNVLFTKNPKGNKKAGDQLPIMPSKPTEARQKILQNSQNWHSEVEPIKHPNTPQKIPQEPQNEPCKPQDRQVFRRENWILNTQGFQDHKLQNWSPERQGIEDYRPEDERPEPPRGLRPAPSKPLSKAFPNSLPNAARSPPISRVSPMVKQTSAVEVPAVRKAPEQEMIYEEMEEKPNSSDYEDYDDEFEDYDDLKKYNIYNV